MNARLLVLPFLLGASVMANAYSTSFEAPTWTVGQTLGGTDGWDTFSDTGFVISRVRARTGLQSVELDTAPLIGASWAWPNMPVSTGIVDAKVWVYVETDPTSSPRSTFGLDVYSAAVSRLALLRINADGDANFGVSTLTTYTGVAVKDQWNELHLSIDIDAKMATGYVNGSLLGSVAFTGTDFNDADLYGAATGYEKGYFDDYSIEVVPEPATMAALGLGVAALLRRRRK